MRRFCHLLIAALTVAAAQVPMTVSARAVDGLSTVPAGGQQAAQMASPPGDPGAYPRAGRATRAPIYSSGYGRAYGMRPGSAFTSGLMGGFLGAGLGGLLFGGGFFNAMHGGPGVLGVLLQLLIAYTIAVWLYRRFAEGLSPVGEGLYARLFYPSGMSAGAAKPGYFGGGRAGRPITLSAADFRSFEELLHCAQAAWSAHDLGALRSLATGEMTNSYASQLAEQDLHGLRNRVTDVRLQQCDVHEAWSDGGRDHATVAMTFSMMDLTLDMSGRVVDGSEMERVTVRQYWRFVRTTRARWVISGVEDPK